MKQRHTAVLCQGRNLGQKEPTWFYVFRTFEKAQEFIGKAKTHIDFAISSVTWELWPCEFMDVDETITNMTECVADEAGE